MQKLPVILENLLGPESAGWISMSPGSKQRRRLVESAIEVASQRPTPLVYQELIDLVNNEFRMFLERKDHLLGKLAASTPGNINQHRDAKVDLFISNVTYELDYWRNNDIFQWVAWRRILTNAYSEGINISVDYGQSCGVALRIRNMLKERTKRIIEDGFEHLRESSKGNAETGWFRARGGFFTMMREARSAANEFESDPQNNRADALREILHQTLTGIFEGFSLAVFPDETRPSSGLELLRPQDSTRELAYHLDVLTINEPSERLIELCEARGIQIHLFRAFWIGIHRFEKENQSLARVLSNTFVKAEAFHRFIIDIRDKNGSGRQLDIAWFLLSNIGSKAINDLVEAGLHLILARCSPGSRSVKDSAIRARVPTFTGDDTSIATRGPSLVYDEIASLVASSGGGKMLTLKNFALDFPLDEASRISNKFLITRQSVEEYTREIIQQPGIYVSCSMRRSGKSTAFNPLILKRWGVSEGSISAQTCRENSQLSGLFFEAFEKQASQGELPRRWIKDWLELPKNRNANVLVLDEYETLFQTIKDAAREVGGKMRITNRFLDQLVEVSQDISVLLLGMVPDAHRIFLEDNPVTPRAKEKSFPLFSHELGSRSSEFFRFIEVVITDNFAIETPIVDRLFYLTAGHPHFAVSTARHFLEWVGNTIGWQHKILKTSTWDEFENTQLGPEILRSNKHYNVYSQLQLGFLNDNNPWLVATAQFASEVSDRRVSGEEAETILKRVIKDKSLSWRQVLKDASFSNYICVLNEHMDCQVVVPIYGRLAASLREE